VISERECRAIVTERSSGLCEARFDGVCRGVGESKHHRRKEGQGGKWVPSNIVDVCGDGTQGCHGYIEANPVAAKRRGLWIYPTQHPLLTPALIVWRGTTEWCLLDDEGSVQHLSRRAFDRLKAAM
jgi:hypothetical protein